MTSGFNASIKSGLRRKFLSGIENLGQKKNRESQADRSTIQRYTCRLHFTGSAKYEAEAPETFSPALAWSDAWAKPHSRGPCL